MICAIQTIKCHRPVRQHDTATPLCTEGIGRVLWCDLFGSFVLFLGLVSYKCNRAMDGVCVQQLLAALSHLQQSLPAVSLQLNTAKSNFAYFHDSLTPLTSAVLSTLSANDIQLHHDWVGVVGAVVGRDDTAIRAGIHSVLSAAGGTHDAFLRRLQLDEMPIQTAMLLLRIYHCIQTVGLSSALQMWAPCWPSVCKTSVVGVQATAALCSASWYASEGGEMWCDESGSLKVANSVGSVCGRVGSV